jgi:hypothetical protein
VLAAARAHARVGGAQGPPREREMAEGTAHALG